MGAWGGGLFRRHAARAGKLLSRAARAAAFVGRGNHPAAGRERLSGVCVLSRSSRGRTSSCGRHPRGQAAIARWRTRWVRGPEMASARGTRWLRLDPGEVSASDPPAPSCLLNAPPHPAPHTAVFQSAFLGVGGGGGRHTEGVGFREAQRAEAVKRPSWTPNSCKPVMPLALEKQV